MDYMPLRYDVAPLIFGVRKGHPLACSSNATLADAHIYDRHVPIIEKMLKKEPRPAPKFVIDPSVTDFYRFTRDSFSLEGYDPQPFEDKIPVAI